MFWTDWEENNARIERAFTDGSNRTPLKTTSLKFPNGLAIDFNTHKLYWCDAGTRVIGRMNFDGSESQVVYESLSHPFGLDVYHDKLYWTDWKKTSIFQGSKYGGRKTVLKKETEYLYGVRIYTKENQAGTLCYENMAAIDITFKIRRHFPDFVLIKIHFFNQINSKCQTW